jgi:D-alanyl-D-alanine carboxypeptidase
MSRFTTPKLPQRHEVTVTHGLIAALVLLGGLAGWLWWTLENTNEALEARSDTLTSERAAWEAERASTSAAIALKDDTISELAGRLELTEEELADTEDDLRDERNRNEEFQDQINDIAGTVSDLDKLSKTDEELLQKYSKVSFLNEHYVPEDLEEIDDEWKYNEDRSHQLHAKVIPFFNEMLEDAKDDEIELWVVSAYRSFDEQAILKGRYLVTYGSGANEFSADQGFSEHQLGTTVDFTTSGIGGGLAGFGNTEAYQWLLDNAHKYGFVLSYPDGNGYYVYEPWHWRFVGEDLADDLHDDGAHFYDWDQRELDQYLLNIFD